MTNKEAARLINNMSTMCEYVDEYGDSIDADPYFEAVNMAIEALNHSEIPNSSDTISRQAALDLVTTEKPQMLDADALYMAIEDLPSAQPDGNDFLEFLWNVINPNDMEQYLSMYNSKGELTDG